MKEQYDNLLAAAQTISGASCGKTLNTHLLWFAIMFYGNIDSALDLKCQTSLNYFVTFCRFCKSNPRHDVMYA